MRDYYYTSDDITMPVTVIVFSCCLCCLLYIDPYCSLVLKSKQSVK